MQQFCVNSLLCYLRDSVVDRIGLSPVQARSEACVGCVVHKGPTSQGLPATGVYSFYMLIVEISQFKGTDITKFLPLPLKQNVHTMELVHTMNGYYYIIENKTA